jgi:hypothetical protein
LQVPVMFFIDEAKIPNGDGDLRSSLQALFTTREGLNLARAFQQIDDPKLRRRVVELVEQMAGN